MSLLVGLRKTEWPRNPSKRKITNTSRNGRDTLDFIFMVKQMLGVLCVKKIKEKLEAISSMLPDQKGVFHISEPLRNKEMVSKASIKVLPTTG